MFNSKSYTKWQTRLKQLIPDTCASRLKNMALLMVGIFASQSVYLSVIARKIPIRAKKLSLARRLRRFLDNAAVDVEAWYKPWATQLLASAGSGGQIHLVVDTTKVSAYRRLLMIAVAYRRRTLPIIWCWIEHPRGHGKVSQQVDLLKRLQPLIPHGVRVSLVGDSEFGHVDVIELLEEWQWDYALRQKGRTLYRSIHQAQWQRLDAFGLRRGQCVWIGPAFLTEKHGCRTQLVLYWKKGEKEPWYLATNQLSGLPAIRLYKRRVWIEEMFGDMKGHGFDLELSRLRTAERLSRLTLAVCLLYVWLVALGERVWYNDLKAEVDRTDRRDLSIFRLGWDWLERRLALNDPVPILFHPNFCLVSGC